MTPKSKRETREARSSLCLLSIPNSSLRLGCERPDCGRSRNGYNADDMLDFLSQVLIELLPRPVRWVITTLFAVILVAVLGYAWSQGELHW